MRMKDKPFSIRKQTVLEACQHVRRKKGAPGCDGIDFEAFERHEAANLYKIWNRMSSGSCFPSPVLAVQIPKKNGKMRTLGIPTIEDRVAQMVVLKVIEPGIEPLFHPDSYGYRPRKSAIEAVATARRRCWKFPYVIELDIKGLFDNIDHALLMRVVEMHVKEKWAVLYIKRWLETPFIDGDGKETPRVTGTPQGGVISPILANLFMHYAFDMWMQIHHPEAPFERFADDALIHCGTREEAENIRAELAKRFAECRLEMNEEKTRIAYCRSTSNTNDEPITTFEFLGYLFKPEYLKCKDGVLRVCFIAQVGKTGEQRLRDKVRAKQLKSMCGSTVEQIARELNPTVRGWINYFRKFSPSAMRTALQWVDEHIIGWAMKKYKTLRGSRRKARRWLERLREHSPDMFAHWKYLPA